MLLAWLNEHGVLGQLSSTSLRLQGNGLATEFYPRIEAAFGKSGPVHKFASSVAEEGLLALPKEHEVPDQLNAQLRFSSEQKARITYFTLVSGQRIAAAPFIDASIQSNLLHAAGCRSIVGL